MMYKQKHESLIPPKEYMPNLPDSINNIIIQMMAKDPRERFSSMEMVVKSIDSALQGQPVGDMNPTLKFSGDTGVVGGRPSTRIERRSEFGFNDAPAAKPITSGEAFSELVAMGDKLMADGRPVAACDCWKRALTIRPDDKDLRKRIDSVKDESTVACLKIGEGLLEEGKLNAVRADLQQMLDGDPDNIDAREKLAALEYMDAKKRESIKEIRQHLAAQEHEKALEVWEGLHPTMRDRTLLATMENVRTKIIPGKILAREAAVLHKKGDFAEALAKWDEAIQLDPTNDKLKLGRQDTKRTSDRIESALREGYEYSVKRQFDAAVSCFDRVLEICHTNTQAMRYRQEAYIEIAREAEVQYDFDEAIKRWRQVLDGDPGNHSAMSKLEKVTRLRSEIESATEAAKLAMNKGKYGRAISLWRKVLRLQPTNKAAAFGVDEAGRQRFRKRVLPFFFIITLLAAGALGFQYFIYTNFMESGEQYLVGASHENIDDFDNAIASFRKARAVPVVGYFYRDIVSKKIDAAEVSLFIAKEEAEYVAGDMDGIKKRLEDMQPMVAERKESFPDENPALLEFRINWHIADLYRKKQDYISAREYYRKAANIARTAGNKATFTREQDNYSRAIDEFLRAKDYQRNENISAETKQLEIVKALGEAVRFWPEFKPASEWLAEEREKLSQKQKALAGALKAMEVANTQLFAGQYELAMASFGKAAEMAEKVHRITPSWEALKIIKEVEWRKEAGPEMVFFIYPYEDDPLCAKSFRAFAVDKYEWPNVKGEMPVTPTFKEAIAIAEKAGKVLPTRDEWQFAAEGGAQARQFSYTGRYNPERGNTESKNPQPYPVGSNDKAMSAEGCFDMTGNVAEWVIDPSRDIKDSEQLTAGGHFASGANCRNASFVSRRANISHIQVGFRAAKRWHMKRDM
ncbi:MAG: tetratricopeptide repeat protein, partial [Planctomycetes bacterium]|nr:tetratricopeptide repeat protein [Planctomycetota bacterium]